MNNHINIDTCNCDTDHTSSVEKTLINNFLEKNEKKIQISINSLLKIYSEQIILLMLYARQKVENNRDLYNRLYLIHYINCNLNSDKELDTSLKIKLIDALDSGKGFFSVLSLIDDSKDVLNTIKKHAENNNIMFNDYKTNHLLYFCSQLSMVLLQRKKILNIWMYWLNIYTKMDIVRKMIEKKVNQKKQSWLTISLNDWTLTESELDNISTLIITECHEEIGKVYKELNQYIPTQDYNIHISTIQKGKELCITHIEFNSRLKIESPKETLLKQIEDALFAKKVIGYRGEESTAVTISDINTLNKWHKNIDPLIKKLDQIPRYTASIIENDLIHDNSYTEHKRKNWYEFVTKEIAENFTNVNIMETWCLYDEKKTKERFKKKVAYLKFNSKGYKDISSQIFNMITMSSDYPLQSIYPPLWRLTKFINNNNIYR